MSKAVRAIACFAAAALVCCSVLNPLDGFAGGGDEKDAGADLSSHTPPPHDGGPPEVDSATEENATGELPGLVAYWDFEVSVGNTLVDRTGHGHHGLVMNSPASVPGVRGHALSFTANGQRVEFSSLNGPKMPRSGSLSMWFYSSYQSSTTDLLFGSWEKRLQLRIQIPQDGAKLQAVFLMPLSDGGLETPFSVRSDMEANVWQHVVFVWDPENTTGSLYVDGVPWTTPSNQPGWAPSEQNFSVGGNLQGMVDEVRLYDRPFDREDVARIP